MLRFILIFISTFYLVACGPQSENFAFDRVKSGSFSQEITDQYSALLQRYVSADGLTVNYQGWLNNPADVAALKQVVQAVAEEDFDSLDPNAQLSFLINAYNILTLDLILSNYADTAPGPGKPFTSGRSIRNIQSLDFAVWDDLEFIVAGESLSLNEIEKDRIVSYRDARIHFAVNCASKGCPPLLNRSFTPETLNEDLDLMSGLFVNSQKDQQTTYDLSKKPPEIRTSRILSWYKDDFIQDTRFGSVKAFFKTYVDSSIIANPADIDGFRIRFFSYGWGLNE